MKVTHFATTVYASLYFLTTTAQGLEPLESSSSYAIKSKSTQLLKKLDANQDGKIQEAEDAKFWRRNKKFDVNKDNSLDFKELQQSFITSMNSPGKELLNVFYKNTSRGGVYLDIFFPDKDTNNTKPVVFYTHGGGWAAGDKSSATLRSFADAHKAWLKEGFVVVSIGYRLVNKTGDSSMRDCVIDCKDAMRFISGHKKTLGVDSNKFYTFGDSAGGQLAMMLLHSPSDNLLGDAELQKFDYKTVAGVSWYGPCDFRDPQLFNHDDRPNFKDRFGARILPKDSKPEDKVKFYTEMSSVSYLTEDSPPLLMIQGDKDTTIPAKQAYRMQKALETIKAPVEIMLIKNAGHNWRSVDAPISPTREDIVKSTVDFILKHKK